MADQNDLNKPDLISNYSTEVLQTIRGHIARLWVGDYSGMSNLVANMRRWVELGSGDTKLVKRNTDGSESTIFDSSLKANKTYVDNQDSAEASARNTAISAEATARANADADLRNAISSEASTRSNADTALENSINSEAVTRASADTELSNAISAEAIARANAIAGIPVSRGLGIGGEAWHDVLGSRSTGITYTNNNGYPIMVAVAQGATFQGHSLVITVNGVVISSSGGGGNYYNGGQETSFIVPTGATYKVDVTTAGLNTWAELY